MRPPLATDGIVRCNYNPNFGQPTQHGTRHSMIRWMDVRDFQIATDLADHAILLHRKQPTTGARWIKVRVEML